MKVFLLIFILINSLFSQVNIQWEPIQNPVSDGTLAGGKGFSSFYIDNNGRIYIIGNFADNVFSDDLGQTWNNLNDSRSFFEIKSLNDGRMISELNTILYISEDNGDSWTELDAPPYLVRVFAQDDSGNLWIGAGGGLAHKSNLDEPWDIVEGPKGRFVFLEQYEDQYLAGSFNIGFDTDEFGSKGHLFHSFDNSKSWEEALLNSEWFEKAIIFDENTAIVTIRKEGGTGRSFRTSNRGDSWESIPLNDVVVGFTKINDDVAFAMLANAGPLITTDKGQSWEPVMSGLNSATNRFVQPVQLHKDGYLFMADLTGRTWKSRNKIDFEYTVKPFAPILSYPENNSVLESAATLEWKNIEDVEYEVAISENMDFEDADIYVSSENKLQLDTYETGKTYFWKVRSIADDVKGSWSFAWNFKIDGTNSLDQIKEIEEIYYSGNDLFANNLRSDLEIFDLLGNKINSFNKGYSGRIFGNEINGIYFINYNGKSYKINLSNN